jgi:hypothetical protein
MLTDAAIRAAGPKDRPYRGADASGLYLHVTPKASKLWRMRYTYAGKRKCPLVWTLPLGQPGRGPRAA